MRDEGVGNGRRGDSSYTIHNFNLLYMTRERRLIKHDNGIGHLFLTLHGG